MRGHNFWIWGFALCLALPSLGRAAGEAEGMRELPGPALRAIESDASAGAISDTQALLYKLYYVVGSDKLPARYAQEVGQPIRCGTQIVAEVRARLGEFSPEMRREAESLLVRPSLDSYIDTAHFRIHYATSGSSMIYLWPNTTYRDAVATAVENSWNFYHVTNNWQIPPSDGAAGGGSGLIDCYVLALSGVYGITYAEGNPPDEWPSNATAYFEIDNDYAGFGYGDRTLPMKVTVAHEYHHVVEYGYTTSNSWWMENMATFMEDEVYDSIDDNYQYLPCFTAVPYYSLAYFNGCHEYGGFLWPTFIKERTVHDAVRQIQACAGTGNLLTCFHSVFADFGLDFGLAFAEFWHWNYYMSSRDDGEHYIEGSQYPTIVPPDKTFSSYPTGTQHPNIAHRPQMMSTSVQRFNPSAGSTDNVLTVHYNGPACTEEVIVIQSQNLGTVVTEHIINLDGTGEGTVEIPGWDDSDWAELYVTISDACGAGTQDYVFDADTSTQVTDVLDHPALYTRKLVLSQNSPNPFDLATDIRYRLEEGGPVHLDVFDASGRQVRSLIDAVQPAGEFSATWDARGDDGRLVTPGVYFYRLNLGSASEMKKMIVVHY